MYTLSLYMVSNAVKPLNVIIDNGFTLFHTDRGVIQKGLSNDKHVHRIFPLLST